MADPVLDAKTPSISEDLWYESGMTKYLLRIKYSSFVLELASGRLNDDVFDRFLSQESIFRVECAKLFLVCENDERISTNAREAFGNLKLVSQNEVHSEGGEVTFYMDFLRKIGKKGTSMFILASIIPPLRIYQNIAQNLDSMVEAQPTKGHQAFKAYSSQEFNGWVQNLEDVLDRLVIEAEQIAPGNKLPEQVRNKLSKIYRRSARFVVDIFYALGQQGLMPLIESHPDMVFFAGFSSRYALHRLWTKEEQAEETLHTCCKQLNTDIEQGIKAITPITDIGYSYGKVEEAMTKFSDYEKAALNRLLNSNLLQRIKENTVGFNHLEAYVIFHGFGSRATAISSSWCGENLHGVPPEATLYANELLFKEGRCSGIVTNVQSAIDKLKVFEKAVKENHGGIIIYAADDGLNDILCLMKSHIGVIIDPEPKLLRILSQFGIKIEPLFTGIVKKLKEENLGEEQKQIWMPGAGVLYTVQNWSELYYFLTGDGKVKLESRWGSI